MRNAGFLVYIGFGECYSIICDKAGKLCTAAMVIGQNLMCWLSNYRFILKAIIAHKWGGKFADNELIMIHMLSEFPYM